LVVGIVEGLRRAGGRDVVDPGVGRSADEGPAARRERERVHFHLRRVEEVRGLAVAPDLQDLAFVAGAGPQRTVGAGEDRPEERGRSLGNLRRGRTEEDAAVAVDREVVYVTLEEIGLRRDRPERRRRGREDRRGGESGGHAGTETCEHQDLPRSIVSTRVPLIAESMASSHSPSAALRIGAKLPPLRSPSSTDSTDGGSEVSASPLTTAPGVPVSSRT